MMSHRLFMWLLRCSLLMWLVIVKIDAACVCNEKGTDYCAACNDQVIVRPKQKYYDSGDNINLPPIGDNCWCSKLMVEPAALPKPCSKYPKPPSSPPSCGCNSYSNNYPSSYSSDYGESSTSYYPLPPSPPMPSYDNYVPVDKPKDDSLPADPISVSLALRAGKAIEVPEAKLAYGFVQKPIDGLKKIYFSNVPEENLFKMEGDVITLQRPDSVKRKYDDKYMDEVEEDEIAAEQDDDEAQPHFTYKQLGYVAEEFKNPKFREVSRGGYGYDDDDGDNGYGKRRYDNDGGKPVYEKVSVDCGCKSGRAPGYRKRYPSKPRKYTPDYY